MVISIKLPGTAVRHAIFLCPLLFAFWVLASGHLDNRLLLGLGAGSCVFVTWLSVRMKIVDGESLPFHLLPRLLFYLPWLIKEILLANLDVVLRILGIRPVNPRLIELPASQKTTVGQVTYANSITLTPGTVSIRIRDRVILVHALSRQGADSLESGEMDRRVSGLEG